MKLKIFGYTLDIQFYKNPTTEQMVVQTWIERGRVAAIRFYRNTAAAGHPISLKEAIEYCNGLYEKHPLLKYAKA